MRIYSYFFCSDSLLIPPYFLSYIEDCLETKQNETLKEIIERVTYDTKEIIESMTIHPDLKEYSDWLIHRNDIINSYYHFNYGHCFTIDVSILSQNDGKYPLNYGSEKVSLDLTIGAEQGIPPISKMKNKE